MAVSDLKTGQIILIPLTCHLCTLIEGEESSVFSHVGLVLNERVEVANAASGSNGRGGRDNGGAVETTVLEALGKVRQIKIADFLSRVPVGRAPLVVAPKAKINAHKLKRIFDREFNGLPYDEYFLWDNKVDGKEALYCTEFLYKILSYFTRNLSEPKPMHYNFKREAWLRYFGKLNPPITAPDGKPGLSPGDFERFRGFDVVGFLPQREQ